MGGCWSGSRSVAEIEHARREECRRARMNIGRHVPQNNSAFPRASYGEYHCPFCNRFWSSNLSRPNTYQVCRNCNGNVYPRNLRAVRQSDFKCGEDIHTFTGDSQVHNVIVLEQMVSGRPNISTEKFIVRKTRYTNNNKNRYNKRSLKY